MIKAVHARHVCVMHRHTEDGIERERFDEGTITLVAPRRTLLSVRSMTANAHRVEFDHARRTADHGTHRDPAIVVDAPGFSFLQVFLCGADHTERVDSVRVAFDDGSSTVVETTLHDVDPDDTLTSDMRRTASGWEVEVGGGPATPIWQFARFGSEQEAVGSPVSEGAVIRVPPLFADKLGLCLTTDDIFGGVEHKHLLQGEAGHPSGRWVYAGGSLYAPKARKLPAYRSVVARLLDDDVPSYDALDGFDEIQIVCRPEHAEMALRDFSRRGAAVGVLTVSDIEEEAPDVLLVDPRIPTFVPSEQPISMLLFADQNAPDWGDRMCAAASLFRKLPEETPVLESAWFSEAGVAPEPGSRHYGIGYSISSAEFPKAMIAMTRRLALPEHGACGACPRSRSCFDMLATPWSRRAQPQGYRCGVREALDLLYAD